MGRAHPRLSPLSSAVPFLLRSVYFSLSESEEKEEEVEEEEKKDAISKYHLLLKWPKPTTDGERQTHIFIVRGLCKTGRQLHNIVPMT